MPGLNDMLKNQKGVAAADVSVDFEHTRTGIFDHDGQAYCHVHSLYNSSLEDIQFIYYYNLYAG